MADLATFRGAHPEYNDMSDTDLADALHQKFYADIPRAEFDRAIGYTNPADSLDVASFGTDWKAAKAAIDQLPESVRERARDRYADFVVANERKDGGTAQTVDDYVRRFAGAVPGLGAWAGEANALASSLTGGDYEMSAAYERAKERAIKATKTPTVTTLPLIGDVTAGGLTEAAGTVAGAVAMPMARVVGGAGMVPTAINVGANAAAYGAADAAGNADPGHRAEEALKGGAIAGAVGVPLGAVAGRIAGRAIPPPSNAIAADAERVGVDLPRAAAGGDGMVDLATRQTAGALAQVPGVGTPLVRSSQRAVQQIDDAATRISEGYAPSPAAGVAGGATSATAGETARDAMADWIRGRSTQVLDRLYHEVERRIPQHAIADLPTTRFAVQALLAEDAAAASNVHAPAIEMVADAITRGGLTFRGMQQLRTNVGAALEDHLLPAAGTTRPALRRIYGALSTDIERMAQTYGGPDALRAWNRATAIADDIAERREMLSRLIGHDATKSPEGIVERLIDMAGTGRSADIYRLRIARRSMGGDWDEVASAAVHRLGRNQSDEFSPAVFFRKYSALSDQGRHLLFSSTGRSDLRLQLDALSRVAQRFEALNRFGNPSGTGRTVSLVTGGASIMTGAVSLPMLLATAAGGNALARMMASPVRVRQISQAAESVYDALATGGSLPRALSGLAQAIAHETQEPAEDIQRRLETSIRGK